MLVLGVLPPAVFTGAVLLAGWWKRRGAYGEGPLWLTPVVVFLAYAGVHAALLGGIRPPRVAADWMPYTALAGAVLGLAAWRWPGPTWGLWTLRAVAVAAVGMACAAAKIRQGWAPESGVPILAGFLAHTLLTWWALERAARRESGAAPPAVAMLHALAAGQVVTLAYYSLKVGQMPTAVAACMGAAAVVGLVRPGLSLARGGMDVPVLVTQAALFQGWLYSAGEGGRWLPLALPGVPLAAMAAGLATVHGWKGVLFRAASAAMVAGVIIALAAALRPPSDY
jgi:hypothetical protein